jgi:predicted oxidoreductase
MVGLPYRPVASAALTERSDRKSWGSIAFGCWRIGCLSSAELDVLVGTAIEAGIRLIDTADIYGIDVPGRFGAAEELLGQVLARSPGRREELIIATKGGICPPVPYDQSPSYLRQACEDSLRRLGVERIDLYQVHRPDLLTHPAELAGTLDALVDEGKVGALGVSNFTPAQTRALLAHLRSPLVATQPEFSPWHLDPLLDGTLDLAMEAGLIPLTWSPLGGGRVATAQDEVVEVATELAQREGVPLSALLLAWQLAHPAGIIPIVGTTRPERIEDAARATSVQLSREDWYRVLVAARGEPMP